MPTADYCQGFYTHSFYQGEHIMILTNSVQIIYEDKSIIVCHKPPGLATQTQSSRQQDLVSILKRYLYSNNTQPSEPYLGIIHRLDQPVSGLLVFAKTPVAAKDLTKQLQSQGFGKHYLALLTNTPEESSGTWTHYMIKNAPSNTSRVCSPETPGSKMARLHYNVVPHPSPEEYHIFSYIDDYTSASCMVEITLETGRHHQIRIQTSTMNCPIYGDTKYGTNNSEHWQHIALCAYKLSFTHPVTKRALDFNLQKR